MSDQEPAFPCRDSSGRGPSGMTLRDAFALSAIASSMSYRPRSLWQYVRWALGASYRSCVYDEKTLAKNAYLFADAMLAERAKP